MSSKSPADKENRYKATPHHKKTMRRPPDMYISQRPDATAAATSHCKWLRQSRWWGLCWRYRSTAPWRYTHYTHYIHTSYSLGWAEHEASRQKTITQSSDPGCRCSLFLEEQLLARLLEILAILSDWLIRLSLPVWRARNQLANTHKHTRTHKAQQDYQTRDAHTDTETPGCVDKEYSCIRLFSRLSAVAITSIWLRFSRGLFTTHPTTTHHDRTRWPLAKN